METLFIPLSVEPGDFFSFLLIIAAIIINVMIVFKFFEIASNVNVMRTLMQKWDKEREEQKLQVPPTPPVDK